VEGQCTLPAGIERVDVVSPTIDGRWPVMPRHTQSEPEHELLLEKLGLCLPSQPPPRIRATQLGRRDPVL